ncbi:ATP-dependent Clp protease adaptor ClpS [Chlorobium phaeobacteroides]|uniref:ATP-dependent Clp protease adaptor protein ClpS n=1 Tax=Chlorobium phaeobacteroides (strain DSM 266 / SMG 266 / 2430) TaxID=290317 RepID=A1BCI9_CHLPD|nr:ATP-dependent Clp protease adaptor ClpS [Chlorobium phaeobacteroides]ABL64116.1 ATP-dependent Clp protease adaptor protein ClpS [Chlorobium phaeobacteroides DSM 266]MBV5319844.1 ATP-dependent Clp protease adaptor ClpS [Chlorobium phaeobacteroides]
MIFSVSTSLSATRPTPETRQTEQSSGPDLLDAYRVVLYNDEEHTFDEVISQIIKAVQCNRQKAERCTWEVHTKGRSVVFVGMIDRCIKVSAVLEEIALKTEIQTD